MKTKLFKTKVLLLFAVFAIHLNAQAQLRQSQANATQSTALQQAKENPAADIHNPENQSPFDAVKGLKEDLSKRDAFSKHYINEDGSFTALIGAGPIHYERNGQFLDIDHTITQSSTMNFPFANTTNLMESYFGATVEYGVKSKTMEGEVVEFMNPTMYWEVNGQVMGTQQAANTQAQIQADKATYPNIYGDISAEYKVLTGKREMNYIIPNPQALGAVPAGADYLVFTEDVVLPFGWTSSLTETGIMIKDAMGQEIYLYENPVSTDAKNELTREVNTIFETSQMGNTLTIKTKVKTEWLLNNERVFPVMVDPTVNIATTNQDFWTGSVYTDGTKSNNFLRFGRWTTSPGTNFVRGWAKFSLSSVPTNIHVNSVNVNFFIDGGSADYNPLFGHSLYLTQMLIDPVTSTSSNIYNTIPNVGYLPALTTAINSIGWKSHTLNSTGLTTDINNQKPLGWFALGFMPNGDFYPGEYLQASNHASDNRPYIIINYSFRLTVSGAYTGASHANGTHVPSTSSFTITPGARPGYICTGWNGGTGNIPATGTATSYTISNSTGLTQSSSINWLWIEQTGTPNNIIFHNYGGSEQLAFNNSRIDTDTPVFRMSHGAYDASDYEIEINTSPNFEGTSWTQTFTGTYPLNTEANFTFNNGFTPTSGTTYYVRARVRGAANVWSSWTTETYSFTYQSEQEIPSWFQTTQAQFESDIYSGLNVNSTNGGEVVPMSGGNPILNPSFETTGSPAANWNRYGNNWVQSMRTTDYSSEGSVSMGLYIKGEDLWYIGYNSTSDNLSVYQNNIDLTNATTLEFELWQWHIWVYGSASTTPVSFQIIVDDNDSNGSYSSGIVIYEKMGVNVEETIYGTQTVDLTTYNFTGNKTIKLVYRVHTSDSENENIYIFYVDNLRVTKAPVGTITSTPIHFASVQDATGYDTFEWNQTPGSGDLKFDIQGSSDGITFTNISGFTDIQESGSGVQSLDISGIDPGTYPHLRLVGKLNGEGVTLHDWELTFMKEEDCESTTRWTSSGWNPSVPTVNTTKIVFEADYNSGTDTDYPVSGDLIGCSVEVKEDVDVVIAAAHSITIDNEIKVADTGSFTLKDGANLVQINDDAVNEGEITVEKLFTFSEGREQYNLIGSPVLGQNLKAIYNGNPKTQIYNELNNWFDTSDGVYTLGVGQSINEAKVADEPNSLTTAIFEGVPFNGKHTLSGLTAQKTGFHLIANPYPSQLDLDSLYINNSTVLEPRFLFWDNRGNEQLTQYGDGYQGDHYAQYNAFSGGIAAEGETVVDQTKIPNGLAAVGSAFMVRLKTPGMTGSLGFKNSQRKIGEGVNFLGKENETHEKDRYWLTLNTPTDWSVMQLVAYFEGGDDGYGLDDNKAPNSSTGFYSILNNHHLAIQGKSSFAVSDTIALGYRAFEVGKHRINLFKQEGVFVNGQSIYLIDHELDTVHNLSESLYEFETEVGEFNERFLIVYQEDEVLSSLDLASVGLQVFRQNKKTVIRSLNQDLKALKVFNLNGQLLLDNDKLSGKYYHLPEGRFGKQVLLLNITTADGRIHSVKVLTH